MTARELQVVRGLFDTSHLPQVAAALGVSVNTVKTHVRHAYAKIGVDDRGDLILTLVRHLVRPKTQARNPTNPISDKESP